MTQYDVAVIGLGAMGSAALAHLAARGLKVIGFERQFPAHSLSSSHGDSRIIRLGYFEDPAYVPLLLRAYENWAALEKRLGEEILTMTGVLQIGKPESDLIRGTLASCQMHDLPHEVLTPDAVTARFPAFQIDPDEVAALDPQGGYLRPEKAVLGHLKLAAEDGAVMHFGETIRTMESEADGLNLTSDQGIYRAKRIIVATGVWISELVPQMKSIAQPLRQVVAWYQSNQPALADPQRMPCFIRDEGEEGSFFGFPAIGPQGVKIGRHLHLNQSLEPDRPNAPIDEQDEELLNRFAAKRLPDVASLMRNATTCRYTILPGERFLIDLHPENQNIVLCSACSGHGFKFASVIGEALADLATQGKTQLPIDIFAYRTHFPNG